MKQRAGDISAVIHKHEGAARARKLDLSDRTTEDLLAILEDHESGEFRLPSAHIKAVRDEFYKRLPCAGPEEN